MLWGASHLSTAPRPRAWLRSSLRGDGPECGAKSPELPDCGAPQIAQPAEPPSRGARPPHLRILRSGLLRITSGAPIPCSQDLRISEYCGAACGALPAQRLRSAEMPRSAEPSLRSPRILKNGKNNWKEEESFRATPKFQFFFSNLRSWKLKLSLGVIWISNS